jgi:hypothetical protein
LAQGDPTVKGPNLRPPWALLPLALAVLAARAADSDAPQRCSGISDDLARLACYDAIFRKSTSTAASTAVPAAAAAPAAAASAATSPEADFGLTEAAKRARDPEEAKVEMPESITGTVAAVGRRPDGELTVTLENGQVWTQVTVDQRARVAVGDTVTIKKAALGSHLLVTQARYATRVRRVK